jgi:hypothetical protein
MRCDTQVGWDSRAGESHTDKLMRASVMELLDTFAWDDAAVAAEARRRFDAHWQDASVLPAEYKVRQVLWAYLTLLQDIRSCLLSFCVGGVL